jgi:hypothetical protein
VLSKDPAWLSSETLSPEAMVDAQGVGNWQAYFLSARSTSAGMKDNFTKLPVHKGVTFFRKDGWRGIKLVTRALGAG